MGSSLVQEKNMNKSRCITSEDFEIAVKQLVLLYDQWSVKSAMAPGDHRETFYLSRKISKESSQPLDISAPDEDNIVEDDDAATLSNANTQWICYQYSVVYSESYQVPVMYFTASWPDGRQLQVDQVWEQVNPESAPGVIDKLSTLTQTEHPLLGMPCYHVHPCNTATLMASVITDDTNSDEPEVKWQTRYLVMWLSLVSPLVNLPVISP